MSRIYMCIDLKSFYASVECVERKLDPLKTNLVVADYSRTKKTICLAVSPSLKQYGIRGRARLYDVIGKIKEINNKRRKENNYKEFNGKSINDDELKKDKSKELAFIVAPPRMKYYMNYSTNIYNIYLKYLAPEDIFVYSIDEVFCDITDYLKYYNSTPEDLVTKIIKDVYDTYGITATAGLGTNLFLAKVAMDVVAKKCEPNEFGVRLAFLDEILYREKIWEHVPITDIWRVGRGTAKRLESYNIFTMGDIALASIENEDLLYKLFGINAELLIDHAWGYEPCTMESIKEYKPMSNSISSGQVLHRPYGYKETRLIIKEMAELLSLDLVDRKVITDQIVITVGYDVENITNSNIIYNGEVTTDSYGRKIPKHSHGTINLDYKTSSSNVIREACINLFDSIVSPSLLIRRINISATKLVKEDFVCDNHEICQFDLFGNVENKNKRINNKKELEKEEREVQRVILNIKEKYGKNAILKGMNLMQGGTTIERNKKVGGHHE